MRENTTSYSDSWFEKNKNSSYTSGTIVAPLMAHLLSPKRINAVADVGCGVGGWAAAFKEISVKEVIGIDGDWVNTSQLLIPADNFIVADLTQPLTTEKKADLAICMEVGEHLPNESAHVLVESLTKLAPVVLFSAAIPHQGGNHHINEQWPEYWAKLFKEEGYIPVDCLRRQIWTNKKVDYYYAQNALLYVKENMLVEYPNLKREVDNGNATALSLVHPTRFLSFYNPKPPFLKRVVWRFKQKAKKLIKI